MKRDLVGLAVAACALLGLVACSPGADDGVDAGALALQPGEVPSWNDHVKPILRDWCGGCHSDVSRTGSCAAPGRCFLDDPCVMNEPGCCKDDNPFFDCYGDEPEYSGYDVAECTIRRFDRGVEIARMIDSGETPAELSGEGEEGVHSLLAQIGGMALIDPEEIEIIRSWVSAGADLGEACREAGR